MGRAGQKHRVKPAPRRDIAAEMKKAAEERVRIRRAMRRPPVEPVEDHADER